MCSGWEGEPHILLNYHHTHFWFLLLVILVILVCLNWFQFRFFKLEYTWFNVVLVSAVHQCESVIHVVVVQLLSRIHLCDPMDCSTPGFPVLHYLPEFAQTHVHWVTDAIQPSHPLLLPSPPALNLSQHQGIFQRISSSHQEAKVLKLQLQHQSFQWLFRVDFL